MYAGSDNGQCNGRILTGLMAPARAFLYAACGEVFVAGSGLKSDMKLARQLVVRQNPLHGQQVQLACCSWDVRSLNSLLREGHMTISAARSRDGFTRYVDLSAKGSDPVGNFALLS